MIFMRTRAISGTRSVMADAFKVFENKETADLAAQIAQQKRPDVSGAAPTIIDYQGDKGITLLMWALLQGNLEAMSDLINYGADPALGDEDGYTVLHLAAKIDNPDGLLTLLEHKVPPDLENTQTGASPLFEAIISDRKDQFRHLLAHNANVKVQDDLGDTPLHLAAAVGVPGYVPLLLQAGADPQQTNHLNQTFLQLFTLTPSENLTQEALEERTSVLTQLVRLGVNPTDFGTFGDGEAN
ncbi:MAG: ankyrin repeat domain-containing protein [Pseudomonadota bacterium]